MSRFYHPFDFVIVLILFLPQITLTGKSTRVEQHLNRMDNQAVVLKKIDF